MEAKNRWEKKVKNSGEKKIIKNQKQNKNNHKSNPIFYYLLL